jgi:hypothetical protein
VRRSRFRWTLVVGAASAVLVGAAWLWAGPRIFQAGPVAVAHRLVENRCEACHTESWEPLERLVTFDERQISTPNTACKACHDGADHHVDTLNPAGQCAACHKEHRGQELLARVGDRQCVECHGSLKVSEGQLRFAQSIPDFPSHPEFAVLRSSARDKATLRFNHQFHLDPTGLLVERGKPRHKALACGDCHQPDAAREYMQPIRFDKHCRKCHQAQLLPEMNEPASLPGFANEPVPHATPEIVRGALLARYAQFVREQPEASLAPARDPARQPAGAPRPLPGERASEDIASLSREQWEFVAERVAIAQERLFGAGQACRHCHQLENPAKGPSDLDSVRVAPTAIPERWLPHSRFSHDAHRMVRCEECHNVHQSKLTADVLLPSIATCRKCHQQSAPAAGSARADCVECHRYHPRERESHTGSLDLTLQKFFQTKPANRLPATSKQP